jgi:hypothetical protein
MNEGDSRSKCVTNHAACDFNYNFNCLLCNL